MKGCQKKIMEQFEQKLRRLRPVKAETLKESILKESMLQQTNSNSFIFVADLLRESMTPVLQYLQRKIRRWKRQAKTVVIAGSIGFLLGAVCVSGLFLSADQSVDRLSVEAAKQKQPFFSLVPVSSSLLEESLSELNRPIDWLQFHRQHSVKIKREKTSYFNSNQNILSIRGKVDL
jgi:hypothetical protein